MGLSAGTTQFLNYCVAPWRLLAGWSKSNLSQQLHFKNRVNLLFFTYSTPSKGQEEDIGFSQESLASA